jgi:hypothetical protein
MRAHYAARWWARRKRAFAHPTSAESPRFQAFAEQVANIVMI